MVLLTQSQVSMALSSVIVCSFTFFLFLAGYILQQQTVHSIQIAIKPRIPPPRPKAASPADAKPTAISAKFRRKFNYPQLSHYQNILEEDDEINWNALAYVQVVKDHAEVCNAVMLFADLAKERSPARRVLLFPRAWVAEVVGTGLGNLTEDVVRVRKGESNAYLQTTKRLLRLAARRYGVELRPLETWKAGLDENLPSSYSISSLLSMTGYDRVMYLRTPGRILNSELLDSALAYWPPPGLKQEVDNTTAISTDATRLLLFSPTTSTYQKLVTTLLETPQSDTHLFQAVFPGVDELSSQILSEQSSIITPTSSLLDFAYSAPTFDNATQWRAAHSYLYFSDDGILGPEYDGEIVGIGRQKAREVQGLEERSKAMEMERTWERLYEEFRMKRMEVCGLDLEVRWD